MGTLCALRLCGENNICLLAYQRENCMTYSVKRQTFCPLRGGVFDSRILALERSIGYAPENHSQDLHKWVKFYRRERGERRDFM